MGARLLSDKKHTGEKLTMELDQVVYEYGKLQLNFVACQRQATLLAQQVAAMNKTKFEVDQRLADTVLRVVQLEKVMVDHGLAIPEPVKKDPEPGKAVDGPTANEAQQPLPPPIAMPQRIKLEKQTREVEVREPSPTKN